jgi:cell division protein YceG involved in septum cleavage
MDKGKIIISISIILGFTILGGFYYVAQIKEQQSLNKISEKKLEIKKEQQKDQVKREEKQKKFRNELKCQGLLKDLKQRWNNVVGVYYNEWQNTCMVKYKEGNSIEESKMENMQDQ